jgi:hypothetical protein
MEEAIFKTISYFSFFEYPPTIEEIYSFLRTKITKEKLQQELQKSALKRRVNKINDRYTLGGHSIKHVQNSKFKISNLAIKQFNNYIARQQISKNKLNNWRFRLYIRFLSFFPQIKLIGLSGTMAMMNANEEDDIDLFIITAKNRLWMGRFITVILAQIMGIRRKQFTNLKRPFQNGKYKIKDKVCLNLFFDESYLGVPDFKKTEYVAHEALQMKPLVNKDNVYYQFLMANKWVRDIFPNSSSEISNFQFPNFPTFQSEFDQKHRTKQFSNIQYPTSNFFGDCIESTLRRLQRFFINRHRTTELITNHQLWFHPEDFNNLKSFNADQNCRRKQNK